MESNGKSVARLNAYAFGLAAGITWGLGVLFFGLLAWWFNLGHHAQETIASVYVGFNASLRGILMGIVWALMDGFLAGLIFAYLYNAFSHCCCKKVCKNACSTDNKPCA